MLHEVTRAIRRLKNGRAAGADGITAELLKGAEKPISKALHKVITNVWSTGREREREKFINHIQSMKQCKTMTIN